MGSSDLNRDKVREFISGLMHEIAGISPEKITEDATVENELRMESVAFVEMQVSIEEEYDIELDPIEVVELNRFGAIVDYVLSCIRDRSK
ncbi:MAG: acyl carrier protein [Deltaproteobacteria bacterium]|nr:acyl carrier protein [Deltaproteobacteria bacterium]